MAPKSLDELSDVVMKHGFMLEQLQKDFPDFNASICEDIEQVRQETKENREMVLGMKTEIALMPGKIVEAMENRGRGKRMEAKEWVLLALVVMAFIVSLPAAFQSLSKLGGN